MKTMAVVVERIIAEFLTGKNLRKMFSHLCNNASGQVTDPISDTVVMMLTCPVQMILTEVGVALFKDRPTYLYPFSAMDHAQRYFVEELVRDCLLQCDIAQQHKQQSQEHGMLPSLPFYHLHHHAVVQMGGGCILYMHHQRNSTENMSLETNNAAAAAAIAGGGGGGRKKPKTAPQNHLPSQQHRMQQQQQQNNTLKSAEVLRAMCECVFASSTYGDAAVRRAICSIILQRVVGMTNAVSREDQRMAEAFCEELVVQWNAKETMTSQ